EACDLVVTAASHALGPERSDLAVYVLNMGQPVKIVDLAERMIRLAGLEPGRDVDIVFTGTRPGERMQEVLFARGEPTVDIGFVGVVAARPAQPSIEAMRGWLAMRLRHVNPTCRGIFKNLQVLGDPQLAIGLFAAGWVLLLTGVVLAVR